MALAAPRLARERRWAVPDAPPGAHQTNRPHMPQPLSSHVFRPQTAPPGWHEELEKMLVEELSEATAAMEEAAQNSRRLTFRGGKKRVVTPSDGTLRGCAPPAGPTLSQLMIWGGCLGRYIRHCYDGCDGAEEMDQMREELRRMVEMFAAAGKIATTDWETLPPPI